VPRSLIFGSTATVERYRANPAVRVHGPGFSKILLGDDQVDDWEKHLDLMVTSVLANSGRGCINGSGIWASRHTREIAEALAERLGPIEPLPPDHPDAKLAAFTAEGQARAVNEDLEAALGERGVTDVTEPFRPGSRLVEMERCAYLRPTVIHSETPDTTLAAREYLFPFVTVVRCPEQEMIARIGPTLVLTAITEDAGLRAALLDAPNIDRLNLGPIPTTQLDWLQPHEGNIVEFLYRARALQLAGGVT
jgi:acyl-CoA reductase-like NAD-dependent aldehyde dehydrogenase